MIKGFYKGAQTIQWGRGGEEIQYFQQEIWENLTIIFKGMQLDTYLTSYKKLTSNRSRT